jgi:hypothetical protein
MSTFVQVFRRPAILRWLMLGVVAGLLALAVPAGASASVAPNATNNLDCNAWSASYQSARPAMKELCTDPIAVINGKATRFLDNGWYVGHDEPSVKFISSQPGSGNTMTYTMRLPTDPRKAPTADGSVTDYGELSVAPWFGLPICDPKSYPQNACTPDSDANSGLISDPNAAGSAFLELQFYPPGFTPFIDSTSCSPTQWCSALTIDSLECTFNFATCNNNCIEPVNFAYIQHNGNPAGPPSPQLTDPSTFTPNRETLMMNSGDLLLVSLSDPPGGLTASVRDLTTGRSGFIVASAANGFMNTNIADCSGTQFTFHAEYSTAQQPNQVPWAALEGGVLMEQEIGHGESCNSVTNNDPFTASYPGGQSFSDPNVFDTCNGGLEGPTATGEGPCAFGMSGVICQNATTQGPNGPVACPTNNAATGALCEFADGNCFAQGTRTVTINGLSATASSRVNICYNGRFQNGDLDFEGNSYIPDWPDGSSNHPTSISYTGPFTRGGKTYPTVQFETDVGGSENLCNVATGAGCTAPPTGAAFYPFWTLGSQQNSGSHGEASTNGSGSSLCLWNFGNTLPNTKSDFGKDAQYGTPNVARYAGTIISAELPNPQLTTSCRTRGD